MICNSVLHYFSDIAAECNSDSDLQNYLYVLILGQLLHGLGGTTLYTVGVSLIDDSVSASSSPMYIGKYLNPWTAHHNNCRLLCRLLVISKVIFANSADPDQEQSDQDPHCLPACKIRFEKFARIFSRRHKQTIFLDAGFLGHFKCKYKNVAQRVERASALSPGGCKIVAPMYIGNHFKAVQ